MNGKTWDKAMQETINNCARAEDLVAYIYKEATEIEARDFERHAHQCSSCRAELAALTGVREAINDWRQHAFGAIMSPTHEAEHTQAFAHAGGGAIDKPKRSALAALREFFTLSPAWMRAATAAAALLFCALVVIAIAYFTEQPKVIVEKQNTPSSARENTATQVAGAKENSNQSSVVDKDKPAPQQEQVVDTTNSMPSIQRNRNVASASRQFAKKRRQIFRRSLDEPSVELASADDYLPFTSSGDEDKLPSLADLANDDDN